MRNENNETSKFDVTKVIIGAELPPEYLVEESTVNPNKEEKKEKKPKVERPKKAAESKFETIWPGMKRCMDCGFSLATFSAKGIDIDYKTKEKKEIEFKDETGFHSNYHGIYMRKRKEYGPENILLYSDLRDKLEKMPELLEELKDLNFLPDIVKIPESLKVISKYTDILKKWYSCLDYVKDSEIRIIAVRTDISLCLEKIDKIEKEVNKCFSSRDLSSIENLLNEYQQIPEVTCELFQKLYDMRYTLFTVVKDGSEQNLSFDNIPFDLPNAISEIKEYENSILGKIKRIEEILVTYMRVEYTRSFRLWDMSKPHPRFEHYCMILWNTPKFINIMSQYMPELVVEYFKVNNKCNRQLYDYKFPEAPFYFGKVMESDICYECRMKSSTCKECNGYKTTDGCGSCDFCSNSNCGVVDVSYADRLSEMEEEEKSKGKKSKEEIEAELEEERELQEWMDSPEYKQMTDSLEAMAKMSYSK